MITVHNLELNFSDKKLFEDINVKFTPGNCYGVIGANGAGKSTFLKCLYGEFEPSKGNIMIEKGLRISVLKQDHFAYDEFTVLETVIMGHKELYEIMKEKDALYAQADNFTDEMGMRAAELEGRFAELDGWSAEYNAEILLQGLGLDSSLYHMQMRDIRGGQKVKVLLAQALFGSPDILLLDEPTNHLDFKAISWLENFLIDFENTVIVISHDRHFLNKVCTHMFDIDRKTGKLFTGNYDFWKQSSELALKLIQDSNKKKEERIKELEAFVARFSANASKSKQATSRKKTLDKIELDHIEPSSRKYPFIGFTINKPLGKDLLTVEGLSASWEGEKLFENVSFTLLPNQKAALLGDNELAKTVLCKILAGEMEADAGTIKWGQTVETNYMPSDYSEYFKDNTINLVDWLRMYSPDPTESYIRGFLGRMLFSRDEPLKRVKVLSGGEKMRCMFSKLMLSGANTIILDQPTNHLDLESISSVNEGLQGFKGSLIFTSHDQEIIGTVADVIITLGKNGMHTYQGNLEEYMSDEKTQALVEALNK